MNRRGFLRMLGTGAAVGAVAAVAPILPSEVFPFRKIFLPSFVSLPGPLSQATLEAVELESFAKSLPDLLFKDSTLYKLLKERDNRQIEWFMNPAQAKAMDDLAEWGRTEYQSAFRIPVRTATEAQMRADETLRRVRRRGFMVTDVDGKRGTITVVPTGEKYRECAEAVQKVLNMDGGSKIHYPVCYAREPDVTTVENELDEITGIVNALLKGA